MHRPPSLTSAQIGARIRRARDERGLKQIHLAVAIDKSEDSIKRYENGTSDISYLDLVAIARHLGLPVEWFAQDDRDGH